MAREIFRCLAGSRLFGTANADSDHDYKAVHLPSRRDILLGKADKVETSSTGTNVTTNGAGDEDFTSHPLHSYLRNLAKMETNAVEMLFAPNLVDSGMWDILYDNRFKILNANKKSFTGFAKSQAMRYAVRGDRLRSLERLVTLLGVLYKDDPINSDPNAVHAIALIDGVDVVQKPQPAGPDGGTKMMDFISVQGREVPVTMRPAEAIKIYRKPLDEAGKRSKAAQAQGGVDWKGLYHAQRVVDEGLELFSTGGLQFPCAKAPYYGAIRRGILPLETVLDHFEETLEKLEGTEPTGFPDAPDWAYIDDFVVASYGLVTA